MLNPNLDPHELAQRFREKGRIQILDFLQRDAAVALHHCLDQQVPWRLAYFDGEKGVTVTPEELAKKTPEKRAALNQRIIEEARDGYQFMYNSYMMVSAYKEGRDPELILHRLLEAINSPPYLEFMGIVTKVPGIIKADAQATCYLPGNFLKHHDDFDTEHGREVAYVISLTRDWQADWGGLLHFLDKSGRIIDTFVPRFNSISMFKVPIPHCVSFVSPFARQPRYGITGWFRSA